MGATKKRGETEVVLDGEPVTVTKKAVAKSTTEIAQQEIWALEIAVTQRRLLEAVLSEDGKAWLIKQEQLISAERSKL